MNKAIARAVDIAGGQSALARELGVSPQSVQQWVAFDRAPARRCIAIEEATSGAVTRHDLRPDVFGDAPVIDKPESV